MAQDFIYGMYYAQIAHRDSEGYPMGTQTSPDTVANGTTTHSYLLKNPVEYTAPEPSFAKAVDKGGQKIRAQKDMGVTEFGEGGLVLSEFDDIFHSYITGSAVDSTSVTGWRQVGSNVNKVTKPAFFLVISTKVYDYLNAVDAWSHWIFPNCQIRPALPGASQSDGENPNPLNYTIVPNTSTRALTGELFSGMSMSIEDNVDIIYRMQTSAPISVTTYVEAGTPAGSFVLGYRPLTSESDTTDKFFTDEGTSASITTCNTTSGAVTITPLGAGDKGVLVYETNYVAI